MWFCGTGRWLSAVTGIKSSSVFQWNAFKWREYSETKSFNVPNICQVFYANTYSNDHSVSFIKTNKKTTLRCPFQNEAPFVGSLHSELQFDEQHKQLLDGIASFFTVKVQFNMWESMKLILKDLRPNFSVFNWSNPEWSIWYAYPNFYHTVVKCKCSVSAA